MSDMTSTGGSRQPDSGSEAAERARAQVEDALELARYVVENGVKDANGQPLAFANIKTIETTAAALGIIAVNGGETKPQPISSDDWVAFEEAYYNLAMETSPVTAETLRNTRFVSGPGGKQAGEGRSRCGIIGRLCSGSPAQRFTRVLWAWTLAFAVFVLVSQGFIEHYSLQTDVGPGTTIPLHLWQALQPWAYGGLGACAYLLRSAHSLIYQRSFDLRRKPEYLNRILLGAVSGGAIILFADYIFAQSDTPTHIGTTALGFIAGYSTDFLFNTVERVITALFPKVAVQTVPRDQPKKPATPPKPTKPGGAGGGDGSKDNDKNGKGDGT